MKVFRKFIKAVAFVLAFLVLFGAVSGVLVCPNDYRNYQWVGAFYENEKNSLDAVYLGSSTVYAFWSPAIAWEQNGTIPHRVSPLLRRSILLRTAAKRRRTRFISSISIALR